MATVISAASGFRRWQHITRPCRLPAIPAASVATRFPESFASNLKRQSTSSNQMVQSTPPPKLRFVPSRIILTNNGCSTGYIPLRVFASCSERTYRFVADHRALFSTLTRCLLGRTRRAASTLSCSLALSSLPCNYLSQSRSSLSGPRSSVWSDKMASCPPNPPWKLSNSRPPQPTSALKRYHLFPTLCWFSGERSLSPISMRSRRAVLPHPPGRRRPGSVPVSFFGYLFVLSTMLSRVPRFPMGHPAMETGFLAIFFAPLTLLPAGWGERPARAGSLPSAGSTSNCPLAPALAFVLSHVPNPAASNCSAAIPLGTISLPSLTTTKPNRCRPWIGWYATNFLSGSRKHQQ